MPILLDTNVYLFAMRSDEGAAFFERRFLPLVFQTHLSSIVVEELYAGALDAQAVALIESYVGALERAGRIIAPNFQDWKEAGRLIARVTRKEPGRQIESPADVKRYPVGTLRAPDWSRPVYLQSRRLPDDPSPQPFLPESAA